MAQNHSIHAKALTGKDASRLTFAGMVWLRSNSFTMDPSVIKDKNGFLHAPEDSISPFPREVNPWGIRSSLNYGRKASLLSAIWAVWLEAIAGSDIIYGK